MRATVVNKGEQEERRLAIAEKKALLSKNRGSQVHVHNLMGKENPDLVTLGHRCHGQDPRCQSVCTYSRFVLLVLLSCLLRGAQSETLNFSI